MSDFSSIDPPLYQEWKAFRKRLHTKNSRKVKAGKPETPWGQNWPFQSPAARTDFIFEGLKSGVLDAPTDPNAYASLKSSLRKRHDVELDVLVAEGQGRSTGVEFG